MAADNPLELIVFSDDWGRHPSSCQHLVRELLGRGHQALWVNTIGMRKPRLRFADVNRAITRRRRKKVSPATDHGPRPHVVAPRMYPGFRNGWQRRINVKAMTRAVRTGLASRAVSARPLPRVGLTTLPITADLIDAVPEIDAWVYYCVDDFSVWPGVDHKAMLTMETEQLAKVDAVVAASTVLAQGLSEMLERLHAKAQKSQGVEVITHGVNLVDWQSPRTDSQFPRRWPKTSESIVLFWGLIDERLDLDWLRQFRNLQDFEFVLAGPIGHPQRAEIIRKGFGATLTGPVAREDLPALAAASMVLIMPYIEAPVTRAMQPLKLLEYLATPKPVIVRDLPSTRPWADCCDVVETAEQFVQILIERMNGGLPAEQRGARERRLVSESWSAKADHLEAVLQRAAAAGR